MRLDPNFPIKPRTFPFFYGWVLVPLAFIGIAMSLPGQTAGFSAFTESLLGVTGLSRTQLSLFYMIGTISSGFLLPSMGSLLDKWGSRKMMILSCILLGLSLVWLSYFDKIALLFGKYIGLFATPVLMVLGIFSLRFFGQGLLPITANTMIGKWFNLQRGRAFAVIGVVNTIVFSSAPAILSLLVGSWGWRETWRFFAIVVGLGMSTLAFVFYRSTPEECGLEPDGIILQVNTNKGNETISGVSRVIAIKTRAFWAIVFAVGANALVMTGLTFHIQAIGMEAGLSMTKAVSLFIPVSFIAVPLSFTAGILLDRIKGKYILLTLAFSQLVAFVSVYFLETTIGYILSIVSLGFASGMMGPSQTALIPKIFGRRFLGSLNGLIISFSVIASAIGPILLSSINDYTGSLRLGIIMMCILPITSILLSSKMKENYNDTQPLS